MADTFYTDDLPIPSVPEITTPGLNDAPCGLNAKIEELNAIKSKAAAAINSLTSSTGGIASSIASLKSSISSNVSEVTAKLNKNLLGDLPKIGLKLQDEFHSAINSFGTGQPAAGLTKLKEIQKQFPTFDIQKALNAAGGILPAGAIPANAADLIKGDLSKMMSNLEIALPQFQKLGGDISSGVTSFLGNAQTAVGSALSSIKSGSGTTVGLTGLASEVQTAMSSASGELSKLGGAFSAKAGPISGLVTSLSDTASSLAGNLTKGIAKIPKFDICTAVPNQQVVNGEVKELPIPPVKPTVNAEPPTPPTPAPTPATPVLVDKYSFPWWTKAMSVEFRNYVTYGGAVDGEYDVKVERVPLDISGSWAQDYSKAKNLLYIARSRHSDEREKLGLDEKVRADPGNGSTLTATEKIVLANYTATWKDLEDKNILLAKYNARYNYRVKNNLIDRQE
jgi:hypothetical protein